MEKFLLHNISTHIIIGAIKKAVEYYAKRERERERERETVCEAAKCRQHDEFFFLAFVFDLLAHF